MRHNCTFCVVQIQRNLSWSAYVHRLLLAGLRVGLVEQRVVQFLHTSWRWLRYAFILGCRKKTSYSSARTVKDLNLVKLLLRWRRELRWRWAQSVLRRRPASELHLAIWIIILSVYSVIKYLWWVTSFTWCEYLRLVKNMISNQETDFSG